MASDESDSSIVDKLEVTRNPFESPDEEREHCPGLSPSIFVKGSTPGSARNEFRWSIDQIANLVPAEIDEFPIQEYSRSLEGHEEVVLQEKLTEYFSNAIMPSPWVLKKDGSAKKTVTFSPHPPSTMYINPELSMDSDISMTSASVDGKSCTVACQTELTIPADFDFTKLLALASMHPTKDDKAQSAASKTNGDVLNKEISLSTLRRKLFDLDETIEDNAKGSTDLEIPRHASGSQRHSVGGPISSPRTPNWLTSSPLKELDCLSSPGNCSLTTSIRHTSFECHSGTSPDISPIKTPSPKDGNVHSSDNSFSLYVSSISIANRELLTDHQIATNDVDNTHEVYDIASRSVDASVKESTRMPLPLFTCDTLEAAVSPITASHLIKSQRRQNCQSTFRPEDDCLDDLGLSNGCISVKESTAHALPAIEQLDMSPIDKLRSYKARGKPTDHLHNKSGSQGSEYKEDGKLGIVDLKMQSASSLNATDDDVFCSVSPLSSKQGDNSILLKGILKKSNSPSPTKSTRKPHHEHISEAFSNRADGRPALKNIENSIGKGNSKYRSPVSKKMGISKTSNDFSSSRHIVQQATRALARAQDVEERLVCDGIRVAYLENITSSFGHQPLTSTANKPPQHRNHYQCSSYDAIDSGLGMTADASDLIEAKGERHCRAENRQISKVQDVANKENTVSSTLNFSGLCLSSPVTVSTSLAPTDHQRTPLSKRQLSPGVGLRSTDAIRPVSPSLRAPPPKIPRSFPSPLRH